MSFKIGDTVGDYQIIGLLGAGGMGKVYKVKNNISDRVDALKILLPDLADDPELADRFIREIKVLASLNHPNIAGLRTAFRQENQLLMVMEFVEGTTLDERAKAGPVPVEDAINYISQALSALGFAHKRGVIHRDIKPANMMLTPDGVIKLMDFGIAKSKSEKKLTQTGTTMGSLFYMSSEQVQGEELDGRSDLYSIGVSLYELVTGTRPFQGKSDYDIMVAQLQQTPMAPIHMMPDLPKALNDIIMISLEKDKGKRFQTAEAFIAALGSLGSGLKSTPMQAASGAAVGVSPGFNAAPQPASATGMMATSTAPAAVGGMVSGSGGHIPTGNLPTVMAPQPTASAPAAAPAFQPAPGAPAPSGSKGNRGLYMALGALIVVAVLAVAGVEANHFMKTRAATEQTASTQTSSLTVAPNAPNTGAVTTPVPDANAPQAPGGANPSAMSVAPNADPNQAAGAFGAGGNTPPPVAPVTSPNESMTPPAPGNPVAPGGNTAHAPAKPVKNHAAPPNMVAGSAQVASTPPAGGGGQVAPPPANVNPVNAQELEELTDQHDKLAVRAVSVNEHVETLRKQMAAGGNNLRADVTSSQTRMRMYMDKFDAALNAKDLVAANKYRALAEHEVETLEKFFGQ